mmetsp:Transcript_136228/g.435836  ORF Transcript_136228/g.435836 Transcript_136228/m.435836 type:complete len:430 (+) Transcript_136228:91-1380(+)
MARALRRRASSLHGLFVLAAAGACVAVCVLVAGPAFALPSARQPSLRGGTDFSGAASVRTSGLVGAGARPSSAVPASAAEGADARATDAISLGLAAAGATAAMQLATTVRRAATDKAANKDEESSLEKVRVPMYILLWYILNIGYNIYNKKSLIAYPFPWACALWQMAFGWLIFVPLWLLKVRKVPSLTMAQAIKISPSALGHLATHVGAVIAFFSGAVSFGHIVKASEPVVSSLLNFLFMGEVLKWQVYASLLPIIGGVGLASASEMSFNWLSFGAAMGSNVGSAARAVYSKKVMGSGDIGKNMDSANVYAVLTIMATFMLIPLAFAVEGPSAMLKGFNVAYAKGGTTFLMSMLYSGFFFYMYNEVAFLALSKLDPVSHAVSNTMKRVVIIITSVFVFHTAVTPLGVAGSSIAILGTLLYSLAKNKFK